MSRNIKLNFKNPPSKFLLKTVYKQNPNNSNDFNLSPINMKIKSHITHTDYLSFCTNESIIKSNKKKNLNKNKSNIMFKNYSFKKESSHNRSKKDSINDSKSKNIKLNKTNIKHSSSTSKTICNSINVSKNLNKKFNMQEKKSKVVSKLFIKKIIKTKNQSRSKNSKSKESNAKRLFEKALNYGLEKKNLV